MTLSQNSPPKMAVEAISPTTPPQEVKTHTNVVVGVDTMVAVEVRMTRLCRGADDATLSVEVRMTQHCRGADDGGGGGAASAER